MSTRIKEVNYDIERVTGVKWLLQVGNFFVVQMKKMFKTPFMLFGIFGIPLILLFGIGSLVPTQSLLAPSFGMEGIIIAGLVFGDLYYNIENSTMKNNTNTSNYGHKTKLLTISLVTFSITLIAITSELMIFIFFESNGWFFMDHFVFFGAEHYQSLKMDWSLIPWLDLLYYVVLNIVLTICFFCFVRIFFSTNKGFIMFLLVYVLLEIIFGGLIGSTFNANEVVVVNNKIYSTGTIASQDQLINNALNREQTSLWEFNSWYSFVKFFIPHNFINQQFVVLFKTGSYQSEGAYYWASDNSLVVNWDIMFDSNGDIIKGYSWMAELQNYFLYGCDSNGVAIAGNVLSSSDYAQYLSTNSIDQTGAIVGCTKIVYALAPNTSYWKSYNNDFTLYLLIILPWAYSIILASIGYKI